MNADEAKREAVRILCNRLRAWDVDDGLKKAQMFMDDLRLAGWRWDAPINRPQPPRTDEMCPHHPSWHRDRCAGCAADRLAGDQPPPRATEVPIQVASRGAALVRRVLHPPIEAATSGESEAQSDA